MGCVVILTVWMWSPGKYSSMVAERVLTRSVTSQRKGAFPSDMSLSLANTGMKSLSSLRTATNSASPVTKSAMASMAMAMSAEFLEWWWLKCCTPLTVTLRPG